MDPFEAELSILSRWAALLSQRAPCRSEASAAILAGGDRGLSIGVTRLLPNHYRAAGPLIRHKVRADIGAIEMPPAVLRGVDLT